MNFNNRLLRTLGLSWLAFLITGLLISWFAAIPAITVLIDRSYCPSAQWQQLSQQYGKLYQQHQNKSLKIKAVVLFSDLAQEVRSLPPKPDQLQQISTYGRSSPQRQAQLQHTYSQTRLLTCSGSVN